MEQEMYYVEFEAWKIPAGSLNEAFAIVEAKLSQGEHPPISYIDIDKRYPLRRAD